MFHTDMSEKNIPVTVFEEKMKAAYLEGFRHGWQSCNVDMRKRESAPVTDDIHMEHLAAAAAALFAEGLRDALAEPFGSHHH